MGSVNEEVLGHNVRVFKWNEELHKVKSSQGLFLFRSTVTTSLDDQEKTFSVCHLVPFKLAALSNRDSLKQLVSQAIHGTECIHGTKCCTDDTIAKLRKKASEYLLARFQFDIQPQSSLKKPTIVIVVNVSVSRTTTNSMDTPTCNRKTDLSVPALASERKEIKGSKDDDASTGSEFVKERKVNARDYKKQIRSRKQPMKLSDQEEIKIRNALWGCLGEPNPSSTTPIVNGERKGLSQVQVAMKEMKFDGLESVDACPICLDGICKGMKVAKTPCSHIFHRDCLIQWLLKDTRCPMCRSNCATLV